MRIRTGEPMNEATSRGPAPLYRDVLLFAVKVCIAAAITVFAVNWIVTSTVKTVEASTARTLANIKTSVGPIGGRQFWRRVEEQLDRAADPASDLPPEKKKKLLNDLRTITARWHPFLAVVQAELEKPATTK